MNDKTIEAILATLATHLESLAPSFNDEGVDENASLARRIRSGDRSPDIYATAGRILGTALQNRARTAQEAIKAGLADTREMPAKP
jgi:hypothetical protein